MSNYQSPIPSYKKARAAHSEWLAYPEPSITYTAAKRAGDEALEEIVSRVYPIVFRY